MNTFVENHTNGKIKDLIPADSANNAFAFLVNAMYFKADWQSKFAKESTTGREFFTSEAESRQVLLQATLLKIANTENRSFPDPISHGARRAPRLHRGCLIPSVVAKIRGSQVHSGNFPSQTKIWIG